MNNWQKVTLACVAMLVIGAIIGTFALKGLITSTEAKAIVGGFLLLLTPSPFQAMLAGKAANIFAGHDVVTVAEAPPPVPAEAPTKPGGVS